MNYLSLFSGACGGDLAFQHLLEGFKCIGYVEIDEYCQKIISQRQKDGLLHKAPIFGDIKAFIDSGCAELYKGITELITAGFPCQPFSGAGKLRKENDERNMWSSTCKTIKIIRPKYAFLENVPGLLSSGYFESILSDLAQIGYDARWCHLSAADCGAKHERQRIWIMVYSNSIRFSCKTKFSTKQHPFISSEVQYKNKRQNGTKSRRTKTKKYFITKTNERIFKPNVLRVVNGVANRVDRLKAIGNGQVPIVAATAWEILTKELL